jgi:hypothetical protein
MRVHFAIASAAGALVLGSLGLGLAQDGAKWDRTKKLTPKVGDKFEESGTELVEVKKEVLTELDTDSGEFFAPESVVGLKLHDGLDSKWHFRREVKMVDGEASEQAIHCWDYRVADAAPEPDYGDSAGADFVVKGFGPARTFTWLESKHGVGSPTEISAHQRAWLERKLKTSEPKLWELVESLLPEGPIAAEQQWKADLAKVSKAAFSGVELSGSCEIAGSLTNVHEEGGVLVGQLAVKCSNGDLVLAKEPETGTAWRKETRDNGRCWINLEGTISVAGSLSLDGATYMSQLMLFYGWNGTTDPQEVSIKTADKGVQKQKHNVVTRTSRSWNISFERAK